MILRFEQQQIAKTLGTFAILGLSLLAIVSLQKSTLKEQESLLSLEDYQQQEQLEKLQLDVFKGIPTFGFDNLVADWIYLRFIQYFGDGEARGETGYSLSPDYFELVVDRDPHFVDAHLKLAASTSLFAGKPQESVKFLGQSVEATPSKLISPVYPPYYLWIYKGVDQLLFLGDIEGAKQSYSMAADWAQTYPDEASQRLAARQRDTVQFLKTNPRSKIPQIGAWSMVLSSAANEKTQERAIAEIKALGGQIIVDPEGNLRVSVPEWIE